MKSGFSIGFPPSVHREKYKHYSIDHQKVTHYPFSRHTVVLLVGRKGTNSFYDSRPTSSTNVSVLRIFADITLVLLGCKNLSRRDMTVAMAVRKVQYSI